MKEYNSTGGKTSGVTAYEIGEDFISVQFRGGTIYKYSNSSCGIEEQT